jgi:glutathione peroxidase-family protein
VSLICQTEEAELGSFLNEDTKAVLIVNVASAWGKTAVSYKELVCMYEEEGLAAKGL